MIKAIHKNSQLNGGKLKAFLSAQKPGMDT